MSGVGLGSGSGWHVGSPDDLFQVMAELIADKPQRDRYRLMQSALVRHDLDELFRRPEQEANGPRAEENDGEGRDRSAVSRLIQFSRPD